MGKENVHTALSLVGYESDLRKAMEYVFGSTLVCDTLDNAKKVAFDKQVMTKTVTLGGDIFDPQGTLSGGEKMDALLFSHSHLRSAEVTETDSILLFDCPSKYFLRFIFYPFELGFFITVLRVHNTLYTWNKSFVLHGCENDFIMSCI